MCLFCSSFTVVGTAEGLWRLFSFQAFAQAELDYLDETLGAERTADELLEDLRDRYRVAIPYIDDFTQRQFARTLVAKARSKTADDLHPFWQHQTTMSRRARSQAGTPEPGAGTGAAQIHTKMGAALARKTSPSREPPATGLSNPQIATGGREAGLAYAVATDGLADPSAVLAAPVVDLPSPRAPRAFELLAAQPISLAGMTPAERDAVVVTAVADTDGREHVISRFGDRVWNLASEVEAKNRRGSEVKRSPGQTTCRRRLSTMPRRPSTARCGAGDMDVSGRVAP